MQLFVRTVSSGTVVLDASPSETISQLKSKIQQIEGISVEDQRLCSAGKTLEDELLIGETGLTESALLEVLLRLKGGAKKRKKKNYSTPKKIKHKKKKIKLAVLKYYKVDENGKISRLRRECPSDTCGAGVFMAAMEDRHYCGKCGFTLVFSKPEEK